MPGKRFGDLQRMAVAVAVSTALLILMCCVAVAAVAAILLCSTALAPGAVG